MMGLSQLIGLDRIRLDLQATRKEAAVKELVGLLADTGGVSDPDRLICELLGREQLASTGVGEGVALPHKLSSAVERSAIVIGRSARGIPFDAVDHKPAHLIFLLVGPSACHMEHLRVLSKLSRLLHNPEFRARLMAVTSPNEVAALFREQET